MAKENLQREQQQQQQLFAQIEVNDNENFPSSIALRLCGIFQDLT